MKRASEKQINLIKSLINKKEGAEKIEEDFKKTFQNYIDEEGFSQWGYLIDMEVASEFIEELLKLNDKEVRPATDRQTSFLMQKYEKVFKKGNKKAKEILTKYDLLDHRKIYRISFDLASKVISEFCA